ASTASVSATSATVRAMGPIWSIVCSIGKAPVYGTSPWVGLCPTTPQYAAGMRTDPPWSPPVAMSTTPAASSAPLPLEEPPADRVVSHGLRTGPVRDVCDPPEKHRSSQTALPAMVAPASSSLVTTVASRPGTNPSTARDPFIIGTPATAMLSLTATGGRPADRPADR